MAGDQLAADLAQLPHTRPVAFVAFGAGASLVFSCLLSLARQLQGGAVDVGALWVDDVWLIGMPLAPSEQEWQLVRSIVAGQVVNGYHAGDSALDSRVGRKMVNCFPFLISRFVYMYVHMCMKRDRHGL